jgi:hypothetical protein
MCQRRNKKNDRIFAGQNVSTRRPYQADRSDRPARSKVGSRAFLLTQIQTCLRIEGGRRSGGVCWRATPRNTRLDSSRTMKGCGYARSPRKHIGPIDPDACTLNQFLNIFVYSRRLRTFSWTAERFGQDPCALRRPMHRPGQQHQLPIAGGATKSVTQNLGPDPDPFIAHVQAECAGG